ncbi:MAG: glycosyltransferase family 2 protein [Planctomycetota bacterium]
MRARIVIPTWNAGPEFRELLHSLQSQEPAGIVGEIVVIDSTSADGTAALAASQHARVISIPKSEFNHGATRALAAQGTNCGAIIFLVQDALPADREFVNSLLEPFDDPEVAGAYARVVPRASASRLVTHDVSRDLTAGRSRLYKKIEDLDLYQSWSAGDRRIFCHFNNVASAIRTSVFEKLPFRSLAFGEDLEWSKRALEAGHTIVYNPDAVVVHSHTSGILKDFARHRDDAIIEKQLFGLVRPRSFAGALARAARLAARDLLLKPPVFSPALRLAQSLGRWSGTFE